MPIRRRAAPLTAEQRLWCDICAFGAGYPGIWLPDLRAGDTPLLALLRHLAAEVASNAAAARIARGLGEDLGRRHGLAPPEGQDADADAPLRRGLAWLVVEGLHGANRAIVPGGGRSEAQAVALYVSDGWWPGHHDRPAERWDDLRAVRGHLAPDIGRVASPKPPAAEEVVRLAAHCAVRYPELVDAARWPLGALGLCGAFDPVVWSATGPDFVRRGLCHLAGRLLWPDRPVVGPHAVH